MTISLLFGCCQIETSVRSLPPMERLAAEHEVLIKLQGPIIPSIGPIMHRFEAVASVIPLELQPVHRSYIKRQLHPIVLCAPFVYRTFQKPLGYAGDYEMVSMMLRDPVEGGTMFAKMLNKLYLEIPPVIAHRNRIGYLRGMLNVETGRVAAAGRVARIYNLGCGPAQEINEFISGDTVSDNADFLLLDFNDETVAHTTRVLEEARARHRRRTGLSIEKRSVQQVIREAGRHGRADAGTFDWDSVFSDARWFHWSGITPALSAGCAALCREACIAAKKRGMTVSFDLNFRSKLWTSDEAAAVLQPMMQWVNVCICGEDEAVAILGATPGKSVSDSLAERHSFSHVAMTRRTGTEAQKTGWSATLFTEKTTVSSRDYQLAIVDRIGTGDSFTGGLIYSILRGDSPQKSVEFAAATGAWKHTIPGDWNRATVAEIEALAAGRSGGTVQR